MQWIAGRVSARAEPKHATDCALRANGAGKPFHVRFDMQGIDSYVAVAFVRLPDGTVEVLNYDSDPMGGGGRAHEIVMIKKCPTPVHLYVTGEGHLNCFPPEPLARGTLCRRHSIRIDFVREEHALQIRDPDGIFIRP